MKRPLLVLGVLLVLAIGTTWMRVRPVPRTSGSMTHQAYVWQRDWTPAVRDAVADPLPGLSTPVILAAQIDWEGTKFVVTEVKIPYAAAEAADASPSTQATTQDQPKRSRRGVDPTKPFGLAIRIGGIDPSLIEPSSVASHVKDIVAKAPTPPAEVQIDFDCPEGKLAAYRAWVVAIKEAVKPVPVAVIAPPAWLERADFARLAAEGPYVLQLHALQRPADAGGEWRLIDPAATRAAVEKAARLRVDFRVALPTYGAAALFDKQGSFVRHYGEDYPEIDRQHYDVKWLRSDPVDIAALVRQWKTDRPAALTGILWHRLPVPGDRLNWRRTTLAHVLQGIAPPAGPYFRMRQNQGLVQITLANAGALDVPLSGLVTLSWKGPPPIASEFVGGYRVLDQTPTSMTLLRTDADPGDPANRLAPGDERAIGWLRFEKQSDVLGHLTPP